MLFDRDASVQRRTRQANLVRAASLAQVQAAKNYLRRAVLRLVAVDTHIPVARRLLAVQRLASLPSTGSPIRFKRRCRASGRARQVLRFAGLARMHLKQQHVERLLPLVAQKR